MPIYRITPAGADFHFKTLHLRKGIGNAVFVNCTATKIQEYQDPRVVLKEYKDAVPSNFKVINL